MRRKKYFTVVEAHVQLRVNESSAQHVVSSLRPLTVEGQSGPATLRFSSIPQDLCKGQSQVWVHIALRHASAQAGYATTEMGVYKAIGSLMLVKRWASD